MANLDTTEIENEQKALLLMAEEVQKTTDDDTRNLLIAEIQKSAARLQKLCDDLQAEADKLAPPKPEGEPVNPVVEIVLTRDQYNKVLEETGIDVPSVRIPDPNGNITRNMAFLEPDFVLECAMNQARAFKQLVEDAEQAEKTQAEMEEVMSSMNGDA